MKALRKKTVSQWAVILGCMLAVCISGAVADEEYDNGVIVTIDREVLGYLWIKDATVNLYENAWVKNVYDAWGNLLSAGDVWADSGSKLNIYGGKIDSLVIVTSSYNGLPEANVTVYGREFSVNGVPVEPGTSEVFLQGETLSGVYENGTAFAYNVDCFWEGNFYLTVKLGWIIATPQIEVNTDAVDFGEVEIGTEQTARVSVTNTGSANLSLQSIGILQDAEAGFSVTPLAQLPVTIEPDGVVEIELAFTPSGEGAAAATLQLGCDDPEYALVEVALTGTGFLSANDIEIVLTPREQIAEIIAFYKDGLKDGTIAGIGPGKSAKNKAVALGKMLLSAQKLINSGYDRLALVPLESAAKKTDGNKKPVDFVAGDSVAELNAMIDELIAAIKNK